MSLLDPNYAKAAARAEMRRRLRLLPAAARQAASREIVQQLLAETAWREARRVFAFFPQADEPDFLPARQPQHRLCLPSWRNHQALMTFHEVPEDFAWEVARKEAWFSAPSSWPEIFPASGDVVLVPGLGFTREGVRLGRGGGFYDRWLGQHAVVGVLRWGLCFAMQLAPTLPQEPHDQGVDRVFSAGQEM